MHGTTTREKRIANLAKAQAARANARPWTDADINTLRVKWLSGKLLKNICADMERTPGSVLCKVHRLGLPPRRKYRKKRVTVELTEEMYMQLRRRANDRETTIAGYMRYLLMRDIGVAA